MQIIELYIKGYKRINGSSKSFATNKLIDSQAEFTQTVEVNDIVTNLRTNEVAKITAIDSDTQLSLSDDIFVSPNYDIYRIESDYFRADLFEDESVVITDSLLNVKDIKKVFTPFSQQFNLPASKLNNKLFRHYENFNIENTFDARYRQDAIIKLNGIDYQKGKIQFKSVSLKDNKAHAYKVVFYGDAVELKEVLGDTKLSGLNYPSSLNFDYTELNIKDLFTNTDSNIISLFGSTDILVPNIHHSKNMRYTTTDGYKDDITDTELSWVDLKPAIRCRAIIEAINNTFPQINLTGFFNSTSFSDVYMWLHKNEGFVSNAEEGGGKRISSNRFRNIDDSPNNFTFNAGLSSGVTQDVRTLFWQPPAYVNRFKIKAYVTTTTPQDFTVRIINSFNNYTYVTQSFSSSSGTISVETDFIGSNQNYPFDITLEVEADSNITMTQRLEITKRIYPFGGIQWTAVYDVDTPNVQNDFIISKQMPEMKVMDFLSGLFKMFNLVVFKDGNDINVQRASFYMNIGNKYDITKYVDMSTSTVERLFPYKEMEFKFNSKKSFLVQFSDEIQGIPFAQESYPEAGIEFDGGVYKVELPFEKMMYERLSNEDTGAQTLIGQGAFLDKKFEPTIGAPLLFCMVRQANTNNELTIDGTTPTHYRRPTNLTSFNWGYSTRLQLNFGLEADEWEGEIPSQSTNLFQEGYLDYVESVFNKKGKMYKVDAYLPLSLITKYKLNDRFIINNTSFRINSIKTNLLTNKTQLELYNKDEYASQILNGQVAYLDRPTELQATSITTTKIDISFRGNGDETDFDIYLDGGFFGSIPSIGAPALYNYTDLKGLESGRTYNITVRAKYNVSGTDLFSFDTGITETTL
jgi:hypothetical protein